ncbi:MAG: c-type cytochrome [Vicinamibacterales bacterium]|nr:c-type cytochrome [Vicinamibacterales bacterium]
MRALNGFFVVVLAAVMAVAISAQEEKRGGNAEAAKLKNPVAMSPESIAAGEAIYMKRCRGCHSRELTGGPPKEAGDHEASNLVDDKWDHGGTDGEIYHVIRNGIPPELVMEPWDDRINETETWHLVNFMRSKALKK